MSVAGSPQNCTTGMHWPSLMTEAPPDMVTSRMGPGSRLLQNKRTPGTRIRTKVTGFRVSPRTQAPQAPHTPGGRWYTSRSQAAVRRPMHMHSRLGHNVATSGSAWVSVWAWAWVDMQQIGERAGRRAGEKADPKEQMETNVKNTG